MTPKVSICIPTYRQTQYLKRTLDSIVLQDFDDYEVIVSDDTPDASVETLIHKYGFGPKLIYVRNTQPLGSPANWNQAVKLSRGYYIKILHHDDWLANASSLSEFVEMLDANPGSGFAFSGVTVQVAESSKNWHHYAHDKQIERLINEPTCLFYGNFIGPPSSTIVRREAFVEYDENLVLAVDVAQYIQILQKTNFVATQNPLIVSTTQAPHQLTNICVGDKRLRIYESFYLFDKIKASLPKKCLQPYINASTELIYKFNIRSIEEIQQCGYNGAISDEIQASIDNSSLIRILKHLKWKLSRRFSSFMH